MALAALETYLPLISHGWAPFQGAVDGDVKLKLKAAPKGAAQIVVGDTTAAIPLASIIDMSATMLRPIQ